MRAPHPKTATLHSAMDGAAPQASHVAHRAHTAHVIFAYFSQRILSQSFRPSTYQADQAHTVRAAVPAQRNHKAAADHAHTPTMLSSLSDSAPIISPTHFDACFPVHHAKTPNPQATHSSTRLVWVSTPLSSLINFSPTGAKLPISTQTSWSIFTASQATSCS